MWTWYWLIKSFYQNQFINQSYLPTLDLVINEIGGHHELLQNLDKDYSINVSIYGGKRSDIIKDSYQKIMGFLY